MHRLLCVATPGIRNLTSQQFRRLPDAGMALKTAIRREENAAGGEVAGNITIDVALIRPGEMITEYGLGGTGHFKNLDYLLQLCRRTISLIQIGANGEVQPLETG